MDGNNVLNTQNTPKNNSFLIVIIVVLILVILGIISFNFINNKQKENTDSKSFINNNIDDNNSPEVNSNNNYNYKISNDWDQFIVSVNNTTIKLPYSYKDFKSLSGFSMKDIEEKNYIESKHYDLKNLYKNNKLSLYVEILNDTKDDIQNIDTKITRIWQTKYMVATNGAEAIVFPGNLSVNTSITKDEIVSLFGEPDEIKNYYADNYNQDTYAYYIDKSYTTFNYFKIIVVNGIIDEIALDHRS